MGGWVRGVHHNLDAAGDASTHANECCCLQLKIKRRHWCTLLMLIAKPASLNVHAMEINKFHRCDSQQNLNL